MAEMGRAARCGKTLCQSLTAILLCVLMLAGLVLHKTSLVLLVGGTSINHMALPTWYAAFALVLLVPETVGLIRVIWHTSFIKSVFPGHWPSPPHVALGLLVHVTEVASLVVFCLEVAPRLPGHVLLPLMGSVHVVALCYEQWVHWRVESKVPEMDYDSNFTLALRVNPEDANLHAHAHHVHRRNWKRILLTLLGFSGVWTSCAIAGIVVLTTPLPWFQALCLPTCLCLLSLCWHPKVQVFILQSRDGGFAGRWRATFVYSLLRIICLLVGISITSMVRMRQHHILDGSFFLVLKEGLATCSDPTVAYPLIALLLSGLLVHICGAAGAALCLPGVVITLPALVATPLSVGIISFFCSANFTWLDDIVCFSEGVGIWCACGLATLTWLAPLILRGRHLIGSPHILMKPYEELFIQPLWNSIFLEHHLILNYWPDGFTTPSFCVNGRQSSKSRVFICTTMYREADFEMSRLLHSLYQVASSPKLAHVYLEAHIFLDNGTKEMHLTEFGGQLVSLLQDQMKISANDAAAYETPYGIQLYWKVAAGMPFFVHLKDTAKVKAKKRWSQVMYMSYVLNFRALQDQPGMAPVQQRDPDRANDSLFVGYASDKEWKRNNVTLKSRYKLQRRGPLSNIVRGGSDVPIGNKSVPRHARSSSTGLPTVVRNSSMATLIDTMAEDDVITDPVDQQSLSSSACNHNDDTEFSEVPDSHCGSVATRYTGGARRITADMSSDSGSLVLPGRYRNKSGTSDDDKGLKGRWSVLTDPHFLSTDTPPSTMNPSRPIDHAESLSREASYLTEKVRKTYAEAKSVQVETKKSHGDLRRSRTDITSSHGDLRGSRPDIASSRSDLQSSRTDLRNIRAELASSHGDLRGSRGDLRSSHGDLRSSRGDLHSSRGDLRCSRGDISLAETAQSQGPDAADYQTPATPQPVSRGRTRDAQDDNTYILATDADMEFSAESVWQLLSLCNQDQRIGGACGRTHPIGQKPGPLVWCQMFEYAKDFWMIKSAQNVIGSVMCCPGCFSLYRAAAVRNILPYYAAPTEQSFDVFVKDTGEDRWMCTLMMLHGWKLEYTAFCDNTTYCPDVLHEFMKQRRRWVLSDIANTLLVFRNILRLSQRNDRFSLAYILYMLQMFSIVLLSPASTIVIIAGGLDIVYGFPFELLAPLLGVMALTYTLVCILGSVKIQVRVTVGLTLITGLCMLLVVAGGSVYVFKDMTASILRGHLVFEEYQLILLLIVALVFAAILHPKETWILGHGASYLLGFPAIQILLPVYAICNIVDQSWGTRDQNQSREPPVSCFSRNRKKYHKSIGNDEKTAGASQQPPLVQCTSNFRPMNIGPRAEEFAFWDQMRALVLDKNVNLGGLNEVELAQGLRTLRNICLLALLTLNTLWLVLLSVLYFNADVNVTRLNVYGLIAGTVYGLVLLVQFVGMIVHRVQAVCTRFVLAVFGQDRPVWVHTRPRSRYTHLVQPRHEIEEETQSQETI